MVTIEKCIPTLLPPGAARQARSDAEVLVHFAYPQGMAIRIYYARTRRYASIPADKGVITSYLGQYPRL